MDRESKTESGTTSRACEEDADRISTLSDDLLVKILSFLPTKVAVSTTLLSKRWECLWMWLPKLKNDCFSDPDFEDYELKNLRRFLDLNLALHRAQIIESFHLKIYDSFFDPRDVKLWLVAVLSCHLRKLKITYCDSHSPGILPSSLYTCESLVVLTLHMPSATQGVLDLLLLDTPSLKYLKLEDFNESSRPSLSIEAMPDLEEAYVDFRYFYISGPSHTGPITSIERLLSSITYVKRLTICLEFLYGDGLVFNQLEHLKLCVHTRDSPNILTRLLEDSPNLRVLDIFEMDHYDTHWAKPPTSVHESVLSSLQTFNWSKYFERRPQELGWILRFTS